MPQRGAHTEDSRWFRLSVAAASAASTALISLLLYVASGAADDLKAVRKGFAELALRVALNERDISNNSANDAVTVKRIGRLESRVFTMGDLPVPNVSGRP